MLRDSMKTFEDADTVILGVSVDSVRSHKKFCASLGLEFDLLSDRDKKMHKAYGFGRFSRSLVLIDKKGGIFYVDKKYKMKQEEWDELMTAVKEGGALPK